MRGPFDAIVECTADPMRRLMVNGRWNDCDGTLRTRMRKDSRTDGMSEISIRKESSNVICIGK